jgi:hypothetical protein
MDQWGHLGAHAVPLAAVVLGGAQGYAGQEDVHTSQEYESK